MALLSVRVELFYRDAGAEPPCRWCSLSGIYIHTYMRFSEDGLTIGKAGNPLTFRVVNDRLVFYMNDTEMAYLSDNKLYVTQAEILARLQIGKFAYVPQSNGNLSVIYTG